jgi:hypothetical protein
LAGILPPVTKTVCDTAANVAITRTSTVNRKKWPKLKSRAQKKPTDFHRQAAYGKGEG